MTTSNKKLLRLNVEVIDQMKKNAEKHGISFQMYLSNLIHSAYQRTMVTK